MYVFDQYLIEHSLQHFVSAIMANKSMTDLAQNDWNDFVRKLLVFERNDEAAQKIRNFYFENKSDVTSFDNLNAYTKMVSDRGFFSDLHHGARLQAEHSPGEALQEYEDELGLIL